MHRSQRSPVHVKQPVVPGTVATLTAVPSCLSRACMPYDKSTAATVAGAPPVGTRLEVEWETRGVARWEAGRVTEHVLELGVRNKPFIKCRIEYDDSTTQLEDLSYVHARPLPRESVVHAGAAAPPPAEPAAESCFAVEAARSLTPTTDDEGSGTEGEGEAAEEVDAEEVATAEVEGAHHEAGAAAAGWRLQLSATSPSCYANVAPDGERGFFVTADDGSVVAGPFDTAVAAAVAHAKAGSQQAAAKTDKAAEDSAEGAAFVQRAKRQRDEIDESAAKALKSLKGAGREPTPSAIPDETAGSKWQAARLAAARSSLARCAAESARLTSEWNWLRTEAAPSLSLAQAQLQQQLGQVQQQLQVVHRRLSAVQYWAGAAERQAAEWASTVAEMTAASGASHEDPE